MAMLAIWTAVTAMQNAATAKIGAVIDTTFIGAL
jgi:hypothetical protein